jgi:hypothetical protein
VVCHVRDRGHAGGHARRDAKPSANDDTEADAEGDRRDDAAAGANRDTEADTDAESLTVVDQHANHRELTE